MYKFASKGKKLNANTSEKSSRVKREELGFGQFLTPVLPWEIRQNQQEINHSKRSLI